MAQKIVIFGTSEIARLACEYFTHDSEYDVAGFTVDRDYMQGDMFESLPLVAFDEVKTRFPPTEYMAFVAAGSQKLNRLRRDKYRAMKDMGYTCASYVSTRCFRWHNVQIGENCFILEDNTLQPFVRIGDNVTLWSGNHIGHSSVIHDHCFISSHVVISGFCTIGEASFMGVNAAVSEGSHIGADNYIGMSAIVNGHTAPDTIIAPKATEKSPIGARRFSKVRE